MYFYSSINTSYKTSSNVSNVRPAGLFVILPFLAPTIILVPFSPARSIILWVITPSNTMFGARFIFCSCVAKSLTGISLILFHFSSYITACNVPTLLLMAAKISSGIFTTFSFVKMKRKRALKEFVASSAVDLVVLRAEYNAGSSETD